MERDFGLPLLAKRMSALLFAAFAAAVLAACTSSVSNDLSIDTLGKTGDAVIVMAAVIDRNREMSCISVQLQTPDGKTPTTTSGQRVFSLKLGSGTIFDPNSEMIGSTQIAPGAYKIVEVACYAPNGMLRVVSPSPRGFATFKVSAGEVVSLGKLIIIEVQADTATFLNSGRYVYVAHAAPLRTDPRTGLNKDLAARLVDRTMTLSQPPLPQAELARICKQRRETGTTTLTGGPPNPTACALAGL